MDDNLEGVGLEAIFHSIYEGLHCLCPLFITPFGKVLNYLDIGRANFLMMKGGLPRVLHTLSFHSPISSDVSLESSEMSLSSSSNIFYSTTFPH